MNLSDSFNVSMPSDREIAVARSFSAPRELVFDAFTKAELVKRWMSGPPGWSFDVCEIDFWVGGAYRYVWRGPDGVKMGMGGIHKEIVVPERVVNTQKFDQDWTGGEAVGTMRLTEQNGVTTVLQTILYVSREARDGALATGMSDGMAMTYARLGELLPLLASERAAGRVV